MEHLDNLAEQTRQHARAQADLPPEDPDLAWIDQRIRELEDSPHNYFMARNPEAMERRNDSIRRLKAMRERLTQGELLP